MQIFLSREKIFIKEKKLNNFGCYFSRDIFYQQTCATWIPQLEWFSIFLSVIISVILFYYKLPNKA
jgi:hypothetical protein